MGSHSSQHDKMRSSSVLHLGCHAVARKSVVEKPPQTHPARLGVRRELLAGVRKHHSSLRIWRYAAGSRFFPSFFCFFPSMRWWCVVFSMQRRLERPKIKGRRREACYLCVVVCNSQYTRTLSVSFPLFGSLPFFMVAVHYAPLAFARNSQQFSVESYAEL